MSRIRSTGNATTEIRLLKLFLSHSIIGWRRNYPLAGKPDFVFPKARLAVFVDGCFWHAHGCGRNLSPKRNTGAWTKKFETNRQRDRRVTRALRRKGWGVMRVWECTLRRAPEKVVTRMKRFLAHSQGTYTRIKNDR